MSDELLRQGRRLLDRYAVVPLLTSDLRAVREALEPFLFDGTQCRDDVADLCQKIDDAIES